MHPPPPPSLIAHTRFGQSIKINQNHFAFLAQLATSQGTFSWKGERRWIYILFKAVIRSLSSNKMTNICGITPPVIRLCYTTSLCWVHQVMTSLAVCNLSQKKLWFGVAWKWIYTPWRNSPWQHYGRRSERSATTKAYYAAAKICKSLRHRKSNSEQNCEVVENNKTFDMVALFMKFHRALL